MADTDRPIVVTVEPAGSGNNDDLEPPAFLIRGVRSLLEQGYRTIFLDVTRIAHIDSLLLAAIVQTHVSAVKRGATVSLLNPPKRLRELLTVTKLDRVIETVMRAE
ncbi:MAG TPA: STAS domain-containing protein [Vicinamibacterales bacterium]|nr:STAS domain-containing protein [Vicinamibacterales bacterium]